MEGEMVGVVVVGEALVVGIGGPAQCGRSGKLALERVQEKGLEEVETELLGVQSPCGCVLTAQRSSIR